MELLTHWPWFALIVTLALSFVVTIHLILFKRDSRSALAWIALAWLAPFLGAFAYYLFGINRMQRRARRLRQRPRKPQPPADTSGDLPAARVPVLSPELAHLAPLVQLGATVTGQLLQTGNLVEPLRDGDAAYPMMLQAIDEAKHTVGLCVYIFDNDDTGRLFVAALGRAVARGVAVRVLIDDVGAHPLWNSIVTPLGEANVPTARFLPRWIPRSFAYANLRNHRKLLIVDGRLGFTGGMNISEGHWLAHKPAQPIHDLQFCIEGPLVAQMQSVFADDWKFAAGEELRGDIWFPTLNPHGSILARGVSSGPDEDLEKIRLVLLGALASARSTIRIVTPYFLPDAGLISALNIAALRGVQVDILLPSHSDHRFMQWATMAQLPQVLEYGCRVWLLPPPFYHTKLMIVDGVWTMLGSANWDPRSLRLNFEFDVECYDRALAATLEREIEKDLKRSERMTLAKWHRRTFVVKLRDGVARLMSPLL